MRAVSLLTCLYFFCITLAAQSTINGRLGGVVLDMENRNPLIGATVVVNDSVRWAVVTDHQGHFSLSDIPLGRINLQVSYLGYDSRVFEQLLIMGGKEKRIEILLSESAYTLQQAVVTASKADLPNNELLVNSVATLNMEEVNRYAGTLGDVARMAQNFAGVSGASDDRNDIIVRGNAPFSVRYRLEGIDIPSPNHWATAGTSGGPVSMLNTNNLRTSDFLSGAFPAEYGNASGAVFDLHLRNGNPSRFEYLGQIGFNGFEVGAEGPLKKDASFLVNYRYSTLQLVNQLGIDFGTGFAVPDYQDLTFKVTVPTKNQGQLSVWGLGGTSDITFRAEPDNNNLFTSGDENLFAGTKTGMVGLRHFQSFSKKWSASLSLLAAHSRHQSVRDEVTDQGNFERTFQSDNISNVYSVNGHLNYRIDKRNRLKFGYAHDHYALRLIDFTRTESDAWFAELDFEGHTQMSRAFAQWHFQWTPRLEVNAGIHTAVFYLNNSWSLEPRINMAYQANDQTKISLAYGRHSQLQPLPIYFSKDPEASEFRNRQNEQLDFMKSDHLVLGIHRQLRSRWSVNTEWYYQRLFSVATDPADPDFSILNFGADFGYPNRVGLNNSGRGTNYGMESTLKKKLTNGFYALLTASVFRSSYRGEDQKTRSTYYDSRLISNLLIGKEWRLSDRWMLQINGRFTYGGGRRYTPINIDKSIESGREILMEGQPFSGQLSSYIRPDLKIGFIWNTPKGATHSFSVDLQNFIGRENELHRYYDEKNEGIRVQRQRGFFPDVRYQVLLKGRKRKS